MSSGEWSKCVGTDFRKAIGERLPSLDLVEIGPKTAEATRLSSASMIPSATLNEHSSSVTSWPPRNRNSRSRLEKEEIDKCIRPYVRFSSKHRMNCLDDHRRRSSPKAPMLTQADMNEADPTRSTKWKGKAWTLWSRQSRTQLFKQHEPKQFVRANKAVGSVLQIQRGNLPALYDPWRFHKCRPSPTVPIATQLARRPARDN